MKIAIVTGGSKGIGLSALQAFHNDGWQTINLSRQKCPHPETLHLSLDLNDFATIEKIAPQLKAKIKDAEKICLVHNASAYVKDSVQNINPQELQRVLNVGIVAATILNEMVIPSMQRESSILYLGSTLSEKAVKNAASYIIQKHAIVGLMRATCQDLADLYIHTACIAPGFTDTEMLQSHLQHDLNIIDTIIQKVAGKRLLHPFEIANLIIFCANNPMINGSLIHAHLGQIET